MPLRDLTLYIDKDGNRIVEGFESAVETFLPPLVLGDTIPVRTRFLTKASQANERIWDEVGVSDYIVRLAIGVPAAQPVGGVFTITYDGDTTSELAYDASGATVQTALNLLASIISAGGVSVTKTQNGAYRISFDDPGVREVFTTDNSNLYPSTETYSGIVAEGTVSVRHIAVLKLETQPAAYSELVTEFPVPAATIQTIRPGAVGIGEIRSFTLDPEPYDGSFTLEVDGEETGAIAHDAEIGTVQAALEALSTVGTGMVTVSGQFPAYTASFAASLEALTTFTVDVSGLIAPTGKSGTLSLSQAGLIELLDGASSVAAILEIELYDPGELTSYTVLQKSVTILDDVIGNEPSAETGAPAYVTTANAVRYDAAQSLTATQKKQATDNIGAAAIQRLAYDPLNVDQDGVTVSGTLGFFGDPIDTPAFLPETSTDVYSYDLPDDSAQWLLDFSGDTWTLTENVTLANWNLVNPTVAGTYAPVGDTTGTPAIALATRPKTTGDFVVVDDGIRPPALWVNDGDDTTPAWKEVQRAPAEGAFQDGDKTKLDAAAGPYWVEVVLTGSGADIAAGAKVAMLTHTQAGTITGFKLVCDPANEPSASAVEVDMNSINLSTGAVTSRLSAVASIATGANVSTGGTISGTQTIAFGDQTTFDIDQGSDGKELRALIQITPT